MRLHPPRATRTLALRSAALCVCLPLLLVSCLTGGGRYQKAMGSGIVLHGDEVRHWQAAGQHLTYCHWLPAPGVQPRGIVIAVPGLDEACTEMAPLGRHLSARGYEVYASDLRGQGKDLASGHRGNHHAWRQWVQDVNAFAGRMRRGRHLPTAYLGQSLGGLAALAAAVDATTAGQPAPATVVLHSPALALAYPPWYARPAVAALQVFSLNRWRGTTPAVLQRMKARIFSNEPDEAAWETSPDRVSKGFTARYFSACLDLGHHVRSVPARITMPVLMQYGLSDKTIAMAKVTPEEFRASLASTGHAIAAHPNGSANHQQRNDHLMRPALLHTTAQWLDRNL